MRAPEDDKATSVVEVDKNSIDGVVKRFGKKKRNCNKGVMRIGGKEYVIDCDGSIAQVAGSLEP